MLTVLKRPLKPQMALISRDEVSVWIILNLEILQEEVVDLAIEVVVVEVVDLAIEVAVVGVVDLASEVAVVEVVDLAIEVAVVEVVVLAIVVPPEACLKTVELPPLKAKKSPSKLCLSSRPFSFICNLRC